MTENAAKVAPFKPPQVSESIGRLSYVWSDIGIRIVADRVTDAGQAELWFYHEQALLHTTKVNLMSTPTMGQVARRMEKHNSDLPWTQILTYVTAKTMEFCRRGEPGVVISPNMDNPKKPNYLLYPVIMQGVPSVIYGDKGVNKTTFSLACCGLAFLGAEGVGLTASRPVKVALLDWESTQDLTDFTVSRLISGDSVPYFNLPYLRCRQPLADDIERIAGFLHEHDVELVLIDSLGGAAGNDKFDTSGKAAALKFFEALRQLNVTSLIIAQNAKGEDNKKTIYGSTYFTYYSRNIFELKGKRDETDHDLMHIVLLHQEGNYSGRFQPLAYSLTYTDEAISITPEEASVSGILERLSQTEAVLNCLKTGAKTRNAVAEEVGIPVAQITVILNRLVKRGKVVHVGSGLWGLKYVS